MLRLEPPEPGGQAALVVPVPTTRRRLKERGYNQAGLIAGRLAARTGRKLVRALAREGDARTQVSLRPTERRANVRGAFDLGPEAQRIRGRHVLLVDDVLTTGATASAAASALERAGATGVSLVTFARAVPSLPERTAGGG